MFDDLNEKFKAGKPIAFLLPNLEEPVLGTIKELSCAIVKITFEKQPGQKCRIITHPDNIIRIEQVPP